MKGFIAEFKEFISRGNAMEMAIGIIIGGAFTTIVNALVKNVIMPLVSLIIISTGADAASAFIAGLKIEVAGGDPVDFGAFLGAVANFLIIAFIVFCIVKALNTMRARAEALARRNAEDAAAEEPVVPVCPHCLEEVKPGATRCPHCGSEIAA